MEIARDEIVSILEALKCVDGVNITVSKGRKTIHIVFGTVRSLDFKFVWSNDHFIGYALDHVGESSQALVSLWAPLEAIQFAAAYQTLVMLRAGRK